MSRTNEAWKRLVIFGLEEMGVVQSLIKLLAYLLELFCIVLIAIGLAVALRTVL